MSTQTFTVFVLETNSAPVLSAIPDRALHAGTVLTISNSASDPDIPANMLTFSLDPGAPPAAAINPTNGLFIWPTTDADANTTNQITVRVTDNGFPALSDTKAFAVTVFSRPAIASITFSNSLVTINWTSIPGQSYRVQYLDNLTATNWTPLAPDISATGSTATATDPAMLASRRFYRLMVIP
jgi:hypothetical protein